MFERSTMDNKVNKLGETLLSEKENLTTGQTAEPIVIKKNDDMKVPKEEEIVKYNTKKKQEAVVMIKQNPEVTKEVTEKEVKQKSSSENKSNFMLKIGRAHV